MPARIDSGFLGGARSVSPAGQGEDPQPTQGVLSPGAVYLAGPPVAVPASAAGFTPNYRPFPLEEVGKAARESMFKAAAQCFRKSKGKEPKGLGDSAALRAATVVPETTDRARKEVIQKDLDEVRRSYKESIGKTKDPKEIAALLRGQKQMERLIGTKLKRGRALVKSKPPRILIDPKLYEAAKDGRNLAGEGSARMIYRLTFLEEQSHIYLHLRGVDVATTAEASLDDMLDGKAGSGSCHHQAIPAARKSYVVGHAKTLGRVDRSLKID